MAVDALHRDIEIRQHTSVELLLLRLIAQGHSNKEVAQLLGLSDKTVKTHVHRVLAKLGLPSRTQAALYAIRIGLVSPAGENRAATK